MTDLVYVVAIKPGTSQSFQVLPFTEARKRMSAAALLISECYTVAHIHEGYFGGEYSSSLNARVARKVMVTIDGEPIVDGDIDVPLPAPADVESEALKTTCPCEECTRPARDGE